MPKDWIFEYIEIPGFMLLAFVLSLAGIYFSQYLKNHNHIKIAVNDNNATEQESVQSDHAGFAIILVISGLSIFYAYFNKDPDNNTAINYWITIMLLAPILGFIYSGYKLNSLSIKEKIKYAAFPFVLGIVIIHQEIPGLMFNGVLPRSMDLLLTFVLWVSFANLFCLMEYKGSFNVIEALSLSIGVILISFLIEEKSSQLVISSIFAAAMFALIVFNYIWKINISLGHTTSLVTGFIIGYFLLRIIAIEDSVAIVFIISSYYIVDGVITLANMFFYNEENNTPKFYYQTAIEKGRSKTFVAYILFFVNLLLVFLAYLVFIFPSFSQLLVLFSILLSIFTVIYLCKIDCIKYFKNLYYTK